MSTHSTLFVNKHTFLSNENVRITYFGPMPHQTLQLVCILLIQSPYNPPGYGHSDSLRTFGLCKCRYQRPGNFSMRPEYIFKS